MEINSWSRIKSPVFWAALFTMIAGQVAELSQNFNWWNLAIAIVTVAAGAFASLNNPTNPNGF